MKATRKKEQILLTFNPIERRILFPILRSIQTNYQKDPIEFTEQEKKVWYSSRGCETSGMSKDDTRDWIQSLYDNRQSHLGLLQSWLTELDPSSPSNQSSATLHLSPDQAPSFLAILNDHRLLCHARHDLGQDDLVYPFLDTPNHLTPNQRGARAEIDLLAHIMEVVLRLIPNSGADWQDDADEMPW
jgi:hypothetical protein